MALTSLRFVLADRIVDFDLTCGVAGFDRAGARRFCAVYAGLTRSERRVAHEVGTRLWLPVSLEPRLTGSSYGLDDEPASSCEARCPAGCGALALALRHHGSFIAIVMKAELVERVVTDLLSLLPDLVALRSCSEASVRMLQIDPQLGSKRLALTELLVAAGSPAC